MDIHHSQGMITMFGRLPKRLHWLAVCLALLVSGGCATTREYRILPVSGARLEEDQAQLNAAGRDGWRVVGLTPGRNPKDISSSALWVIVEK